MAPIPLSGAFQKSYIENSLYPENVVHRSVSIHPVALRGYKDRLNAAASSLFVDVDRQVDMSIRDLDATLENGSFKGVEKLTVLSEEKLENFLGVHTSQDANSTNTTVSARRKDPKSRFIYMWGVHSRAPLQITLSMLTKICTYHQIMPAYLDFLSVFGHQDQRLEPRDLRFSGFRSQLTLKETHQQNATALKALNRSGQQYQMCYNLKGVTFISEDTKSGQKPEWSVRQAAIHHQFDIVFGTALWVVAKGHLDLQEQYKLLTGKDGREEDKSFGTLVDCFRSSLSAHLLFANWAGDDWRGYIRHLEDEMEKGTSMAVYGVREEGHAYQQYEPKDIQDLQRMEDRTNEAIMVLEGNISVLKSLRKFYDMFRDNKDFPAVLKDECGDDLVSFGSQIDDLVGDFEMQAARARLLVKLSNDRKELVSQHLQSQSAKRIQQLNENMEKEAIVMRIITTVTLIYLPATFVSTLFSTDIIKYQDQNGGPPGNGQFSEIAMYRWIQVTLPLTLLTLVVAWSWRHFAESKRAAIQDGFVKHKRGGGFQWRNFIDSGSSEDPLLPVAEKSNAPQTS